MAKVEARKRSVLNYQSFYVQIDDCKPSYSFSLNSSKYLDGPLWEHLEITLNGTFLSPERMKGLRVPLVFLGRRDDQAKLENLTDSDWKPRNIGVLTIRGKRREFLGSLPYDALWGLSHVLLSASGAFRIIHLYGIFARGRVDVTSVNFSREVDPEDLPEEAESGGLV